GLEGGGGKEKGKRQITVGAAAVPGAYALRLYDDDGATVARPFLVGMLPEIMEREPNDDFKKPQILDSANVTVNGRLGKPGDVDTFAAAVKKGQTLVESL